MFPGGRPGPGHRLFAVDQDGARIGHVWVAPLPQRPGRTDVAWLYNFENFEASRGQGTGRETLALLEGELRAEGQTELALNVFGHNRIARALHASAGYREVAITMAKPLDSEPVGGGPSESRGRWRSSILPLTLSHGAAVWRVAFSLSRYRGANTQNSLPSGSAITTQLTSPWPMSIRVAPREMRRSTSAC